MAIRAKLQLRIPAVQIDALRQIAKRHDRPVSWVASRMLEQAIAKEQWANQRPDTPHVPASDTTGGVYPYGSDTVGATGHA